MESDEIKSALVMLGDDEVQLITECLLNCPMQASVKDMPQIIGMVQGIVKKIRPPSPSTPSATGKGG